MADPAPSDPGLYPVLGEIGDAAAFDEWISTVRETVVGRLRRLGHPSATGHDVMVEPPITSEEVLQAADPALYDALADAVIDGSVGVSIGYGFDVYDPVVEAIAAEHIAAIKTWLPSFAQEIADWVNEGLSSGASIEDMATAAMDTGLGDGALSVADTAPALPAAERGLPRLPPPTGQPSAGPTPGQAPAQGPPIPASPMSTVRARTIARTETVAASNGGVYAGWSNAGIEGKTWLATHDDRTRIDHIALDGVTVPMDADFLVGGSPARYPGDSRLPPRQRVNCRCTIISNEAPGKGHIAGTDEELAARAAKLGLPTDVDRQEMQLSMLARLCSLPSGGPSPVRRSAT